MPSRVAVLLVLALPLAGCAAPAAPPAPSGLPAPGADLAGEVAHAFRDQGRSEGFACAAGSCQFLESPEDVVLPGGAGLRRFEATVAWTPRDPTLRELEVFLLSVDEAGDWSWEESPDTYWVGPSPLPLAGVAPPGAAEYHLHARAIHRAGDAARGGLSQPYAVEGVAHAVPAAAGAGAAGEAGRAGRP